MVKQASKKQAPKKTAKSSSVAKKPVARKKAVAKQVSASTKVDYYPNRMMLAVSVLGGTMIVLLSILLVLGLQ